MESDDPYRAPRTRVEPRSKPSHRHPHASKAQRFVTFIVDMLICYATVFVVVVAWMVLAASDADLESVDQPGADLAVRLVGLLIIVAYYVVFEAAFGRTPGKWIAGTRVVNLLGEAPTFRQIVGRSFSRLIPLEAFTFLGSGPGLHDKLSNTRVVRTR